MAVLTKRISEKNSYLKIYGQNLWKYMPTVNILVNLLVSGVQ